MSMRRGAVRARRARGALYREVNHLSWPSPTQYRAVCKFLVQCVTLTSYFPNWPFQFQKTLGSVIIMYTNMYQQMVKLKTPIGDKFMLTTCHTDIMSACIPQKKNLRTPKTLNNEQYPCADAYLRLDFEATPL